MAWHSILPESMSSFETWMARMFLFFAAVTFGPWALFILYDIVLYLWRAMLYEIPYIGGRAQGRTRPRAPSLTERVGGHRRNISLTSTLSLGNNATSPVSDLATGKESTEAIRKR